MNGKKEELLKWLTERIREIFSVSIDKNNVSEPDTLLNKGKSHRFDKENMKGRIR